MRSIENDLDVGNKIDSGRMFAFNGLVGRLKNVKEYEDVVSKKEKDTESEKNGINEEVLRLIEREVFGH